MHLRYICEKCLLVGDQKLFDISLQKNLEQQFCLHGAKSIPWLQNIYGNPYFNGSATERYEELSRFLTLNSVDETSLENRVTYDTPCSYVNHSLRTGNRIPRKHGGANYVVVSD